MKPGEKSGTIFNIQKFSVHDGPGIRTTVFMKGCPLRCRWCSNPESVNPEPEIGIIRSTCNRCGKCLKACPEEAISFDSDGVIRFRRDLCTACGECVESCAPGAITVYGRQAAVDEVFKDVSRDRMFYEGSGGGVTVSGGEPLRQVDFVIDLFQRCRDAGIGTCLDTSGYAPAGTLEKVLPLTDHVLYDLKHMDCRCHRQFTGVSNELILANAKTVAATGTPMLCRIPLIKSVNDGTRNIEETARFIKSLGNGIAVEVLPYHRLGIGKYQTLDKPYTGDSFVTPSSGEMEAVKAIFEEHGVNCTIGG